MRTGRRCNWTLALSLITMLAVACGGPEELGSGEQDAVDDLERGTFSGRSWPVLRLWAQSRDVVTAQYLLRHHGESLSLNGRLDWTTRKAVIQFQQRRGLGADGVIGGRTWENLIQSVSRGETGWKVGAVQDLLLRRYGYSIAVTNAYGPTTEAHVKTFQKSRCLPTDGAVGFKTWHALVARVSFCSGGGVGGGGGAMAAAAARPAAAARAASGSA